MAGFKVLISFVLVVLTECILVSKAFVTPSLGTFNSRVATVDGSTPSFDGIGRSNNFVALDAGSKKRRRRRRKDASVTPTPSADITSEDVAVSPTKSASDTAPAPAIDELSNMDEEEEVNPSDILDVAKFKFEGESPTSPAGTSLGGPSAAVEETVQPESSEGAIPLPDIREALKKKQLEEELARAQEEEEEQRVLVNRSDKEAFAKLLEQQPYADADDSLFEQEEYGTVSALLAEGAKPFLGIPSGPLQVGHFIGALVIVLMAFVEYPGFPLTNLPSPLRGALQGGLATVYAINIVLAVLAVFKAGERGQPAALWVAKTFSVGGLAFDQLTQLPTLEEIEKAKARKGKRALKNKRK